MTPRLNSRDEFVACHPEEYEKMVRSFSEWELFRTFCSEQKEGHEWSPYVGL
jgi:hypothetical protein